MAATAKEQSLGTKPTTLAVVYVLLALFHSSISLLNAVYVFHFPFGATMEFSDRESSPDPSRSDGSSYSCSLTPLLKSALMFCPCSNVSSETLNNSLFHSNSNCLKR